MAKLSRRAGALSYPDGQSRPGPGVPMGFADRRREEVAGRTGRAWFATAAPGRECDSQDGQLKEPGGLTQSRYDERSANWRLHGLVREAKRRRRCALSAQSKM